MSVSPTTQDLRGKQNKWANGKFATAAEGVITPAPAGVYSDADYPLTPDYDETGAIFFSSTASGANNGSSWSDAYTDEESALNALCASSAGTMLTCRGTFDIGTGIVLTGDGGVGDINNWYIFRADPVQGCDITASTITGIEFGGQAYWHVDGFNQTGGSRIFSYYSGGSSSGGLDHFTFRNLTGIMTQFGDNVGTVHADVGSDYVGVFDSNIQGPGTGGHQNTACVFLSRVPHWRVQNCVLHNAPQPIYYKHLAAANHINSPAGYFIGNHCHTGVNSEDRDVHLACSDTTIEHNIFDCRFNLLADGGGDIGQDNNTIQHNTFMQQMRVAGNNMVSSNNVINDNVFAHQYMLFPYVATASANTSNYNLFGSTIYNNSTTLSLVQWQTASNPAGQDVNSVGGAPTFAGGASPNTIAGFALSGGLGVSAASDGTDMGADVSLVGVN